MKTGFVEEIIEVPEGIECEIQKKTVTVKKGDKTITKTFDMIGVVFKKEGNRVQISTKYPKKKTAAMLKTAAAHLKNMINGLQEEYVYKLAIIYSHFPMTVTVKDGFLEINNFAGEKKTRKAKIMANTKVEVKGKEVTVRSHNKENAGQTTANIESATKVKGKDKRIFQDGIWITEKPKKR
ncbi:MAG: 50S ribosomal protein L6 [Candidatus Diapherotrites archaeon]